MTHDESISNNPDLDDQPPLPPWRRSLLVVAGLSLLTFGAFLNADHFRPGPVYDALPACGPTLASKLLRKAESPPITAPAPVAPVARAPLVTFKVVDEAKPSSESKSGLYSMKGPIHAVPMMARNFDPNGRPYDPNGRPYDGGLLGMGNGSHGQLVALGGRQAVGSDDEDVWASPKIIDTGVDAQQQPIELVAARTPVKTDEDAKSTFSIDVDTASYAMVRRSLLEQKELPEPGSVRSEELVNYFDYDYPRPTTDVPFSVTAEVGPSPWSSEHRLVHIGLRGAVPASVPARNLVYLVDVSGSMNSPDKLPLVKHGLRALTEQLDDLDRLSIVVYAGGAGVALWPSSGGDHATILAAIDRLEPGGSGTNGAAGIHGAYALAEQNFVEGGINRVILATDGDFNVGVSDHDELVELIETKRESGVFLSVLGFGVGTGADRTMEQIADHGNGNYAMIDCELEARKVLVDEAGATLQTIAKDVKLQIEFDDEQIAEHRLIGYANRRLEHRDFADDTEDAGEIGAGHTVTAIYEVVPKREFGSAPIMTVDLRYKQPEGDRSELLRVPIVGRTTELDATSNDFRFAAAVAAFGEALNQVEGSAKYADILALAAGSLGSDRDCYRHQFMAMVWRAGTLSGETIARPDLQCTPVVTPTSSHPAAQVRWAIALATPHPPRGVVVAQQDWMSFVLEILRLLPPLLALPLFVMAFVDRRVRNLRRARDSWSFEHGT